MSWRNLELKARRAAKILHTIIAFSNLPVSYIWEILAKNMGGDELQATWKCLLSVSAQMKNMR